MTLSLWRYSHLILALSTAVFIFIAAVTGIILAFEPISNQLHPYSIDKANTIKLSEVLVHLKANYDEIYSLEIDENGFLKASVLEKNGGNGKFYINPKNGASLGNRIKKKPIFEFATNLHRSLFLKSTGRFIVGLVSLLLFIIALTGVLLIAKRQGGFRRWFAKVIKEDFNQYAHVVLGRYMLAPIIIITLTGVFLSLERFSVLPTATSKHIGLEKQENQVDLAPEEFEIFRKSTLDDLVSLEFPFSPDEEDYYILKLKDKQVYVHQYNGRIISEAEVSPLTQLLDLSIVLHTGKGTIIWSLVLGIACISILFFMYSGFSMTWKRTRGKTTFKNQFNKANAEYILLTGSETGSTLKFAHAFARAMLAESKSIFIDSLSNYTVYPNAKQILIFTSTYGEGEAPYNAKTFIGKLRDVKQQNTLEYAVVGFGSLLYPDYCKYAIEVDNQLHEHKKFVSQLPLFKINNQSLEAFKSWVVQWCNVNKIQLKIDLKDSATKPRKLKSFKVIRSTSLNTDDTFTLQLKPKSNIAFNSGDLLAVYPKAGEAERLYSIGKVDNLVTLSIKRHEKGVASNLLFDLGEGHELKAKIKLNRDFHFPNHAKSVILIANGTGIAPFLGMINQNIKKVETHLFWGGRNEDSISLYSEIIDKAKAGNQLSSFHIAYSKQGQKRYVQNLVEEHKNLFCKVLSKNGVVMICGSIAMQNEVLDKLGKLTTSLLKKPLSEFEKNDQIKMDCY